MIRHQRLNSKACSDFSVLKNLGLYGWVIAKDNK